MHNTTKLILKSLSKKKTPIARKDIEKEVGIKTTAANRHLRPLVDSSRAKRLNDGTATKYKLSEPSSAMKEYYFIYMNKEHIGYFGFTNGYYLFAYSNAYLMDDLSEPISSTLPISEKIYRSEVIFPAIEALLPEGIDKEILERKSGIPTEFYLFEYLNTDTADMIFSRTKLTFSGKRPTHKSYLLAKEEILQEYRPFPNILPFSIEIDDDALFPRSDLTEEQLKKIRIMSLSGYQHKLKISINKTKKSISQDQTDGVAYYFMKPYNKKRSDERDEHYFPHLALNEHLFMSFAKEQLDFDVPYSALCKKEQDKEFHYIVKYFNKLRGFRYSMDEVSSLMGLDSDTKYQTTAEKMFSKIGTVLVLEQEKIRMLSYFFYSYVIMHEDMHTKNLSIINDRGKYFAAPLYDIAATGFYDNAYGYESHLPVRGKKNNIRLKDFMGLAERLDVNKSLVKKEFTKIIERYTSEFPDYIDKVRTIGSLPYYHKKLRARDGEAVSVASQCVEFADVLEKNYHERINRLITLGYYRQLGIKAYKRIAKIEDIARMKDEDKIIERLRLFSGGISAMLLAELGRRKLYKAMDVL